MCDVPSTAAFCSEPIECFPGMASKFFLKRFVTMLVAPIIIGIIVHFRFHIRCIIIIIIIIVIGRPYAGYLQSYTCNESYFNVYMLQLFFG